ncbi:MAG: cysteine desulfurase family protein [Acetobacteraceae bacterium]
MMCPNRPVYLDNQATTPCDSRVVEAMLPWFTEQFGNPASIEHVLGRAAEAAVEAARESIARLINASAAEIVFTSGATESNNLAIKGFARFAATMDAPRRRIVTLATEHKCVLESVRDLAAEGFAPVVLPVDRDGLLDPGVLEEALAEPALLVSVMAVNNETGVIQDIPRLAAIAHQHGARFHCDAAQAAGKIPVDVRAWDVDLMSLSGHKIYGPKGIGALYVRRRPRIRLAPLFSGGGQERGLRSGTLAAALIVGFGEAARLAVLEAEAERPRIASLREQLERRLSEAIPGLVLNGSARARIGGNLNLTFPRARAAELMAAAPDLCVSTGSACSAASIEPSYVLRAMGLSEEAAASSLRIGIGRFTSAADIDFAVVALTAAHAAARAA